MHAQMLLRLLTAGLACALNGSGRRTISVRRASIEDCGCATVYGGDVGEAARQLDHFSVITSTQVLSVEGAARTVLDPSFDGVAVVSLLRSFG